MQLDDENADDTGPDLVTFADVGSLLENPPNLDAGGDEGSPDSYDYNVTFPQHHRCCSHTLSLTGSNDVQKIEVQNPVYGGIHRATMAAIWNKVSRSM